MSVEYEGSDHPPVHVYYAVDGTTAPRQALWDVFVDAPGGAPRSWVGDAERRVFDAPFVRDRNLGIPYANPSPILAFVADGRLHWITLDEDEAIVARIWRFDEDALTPVRTLPGRLLTHYF